MKYRIEFLDGLRGLAIVAVVTYHAFVRWPEIYPYGNRFANNYLFNTARSGVFLFFIISGFVILMTLRKSEGFLDFVLRRWYRLFPAMLICSVIVFTTSGLFPNRPGGEIHWLDLLPGITFIGDDATLLWSHFGPVQSLEAAFWSLYVEVRFYIVFGLSYFLLGERISLALIFGLFLAGFAADGQFQGLHIDYHSRAISIAHNALYKFGLFWPAKWIGCIFYGFFVTGALLFLFYVSRQQRYLWLAVCTGLLSCAVLGPAADIVLTSLFILCLISERLRQVLANRYLVFVGFISYPFYLLHENMMVAMISKLGVALPGLPALLVPVIPMCIVGTIAWVVARYLESAVRRLISRKVPLSSTGPAGFVDTEGL